MISHPTHSYDWQLFGLQKWFLLKKNNSAFITSEVRILQVLYYPLCCIIRKNNSATASKFFLKVIYLPKLYNVSVSPSLLHMLNWFSVLTYFSLFLHKNHYFTLNFHHMETVSLIITNAIPTNPVIRPCSKEPREEIRVKCAAERQLMRTGDYSVILQSYSNQIKAWDNTTVWRASQTSNTTFTTTICTFQNVISLQIDADDSKESDNKNKDFSV